MVVLVPIAIFIWVYVCFYLIWLRSNLQAFEVQKLNGVEVVQEIKKCKPYQDAKLYKSISSCPRRRRNEKTSRNKMPIRFFRFESIIK